MSDRWCCLACGWPNHKTYKWSDSRELFTYGLENFTYRSFEEETFSGREQLLMPIPVLRAQNDATDRGGHIALWNWIRDGKEEGLLWS